MDPPLLFADFSYGIHRTNLLQSWMATGSYDLDIWNYRMIIGELNDIAAMHRDDIKHLLRIVEFNVSFRLWKLFSLLKCATFYRKPQFMWCILGFKPWFSSNFVSISKAVKIQLYAKGIDVAQSAIIM